MTGATDTELLKKNFLQKHPNIDPTKKKLSFSLPNLKDTNPSIPNIKILNSSTKTMIFASVTTKPEYNSFALNMRKKPEN
jgi:hypothetical protein